jgi:hypothetical protein
MLLALMSYPELKALMETLNDEAMILDQLNKNMEEIYRTFREFALLVHLQEETINSIGKELFFSVLHVSCSA